MPASEDLITSFKGFYTDTVRPDLAGIVRSSERRVRKQLRGEMRATAEGLRGEMGEAADGLRAEMREMEGRLRLEIRDGDARVRDTFQEALEEFRRDMNGHFDTVHKRLGHLETEYRMLVVGLRRLEDAQSPGAAE
jgi:hypothetical protein